MSGRQPLTTTLCWQLLERARELHVAAVVGARPLLRSMHAAALHEPRELVLHGSPAGEKSAWIGAPVVAAAEEVVARIPSWMRDPERACPATTFYRSVQIEGTLQPLEDRHRRTSALQILMQNLQPEGRYRPLHPDDPLYAGPIRGLGMWRIVPERISGVQKLGQHLRVSELRAILDGLWARGAPGDLAALETLRAAHPASPSFGPPLPEGLRLRCHPTPADLQRVVSWLRPAYWNEGVPPAAIHGAQRHGAWVGLEREGELVASARAVSDRHKRATVYDVVVAPHRRREGLGSHLMRCLHDHPEVRDVLTVSLVTRDAAPFYGRFGYEVRTTWSVGGSARTLLVRTRTARG